VQRSRQCSKSNNRCGGGAHWRSVPDVKSSVMKLTHPCLRSAEGQLRARLAAYAQRARRGDGQRSRGPAAHLESSQLS